MKGLDGKEGVDGSSPSEGSAKAPHIQAFPIPSICTISNVHQIWSRLWSFQTRAALLRSRKTDGVISLHRRLAEVSQGGCTREYVVFEDAMCFLRLFQERTVSGVVELVEALHRGLHLLEVVPG